MLVAGVAAVAFGCGDFFVGAFFKGDFDAETFFVVAFFRAAGAFFLAGCFFVGIGTSKSD